MAAPRPRIAGLVLCLLGAGLGAQAPAGPARILSFQAVPSTVSAGGTLELRWSALDTDRVRLEPLDLDLPPEGRTQLVVRQRTIFWLHASNSLGGQSQPLVVEIRAEGPQASVPRASVPRASAPRASAPRAEGSPGQEAPSAGPAPPGGAWIQFAALAEPARVEALVQELGRRSIGPLSVFDIPDPGGSGRTLQRVRLGPFRTLREARERLVSLLPKVKPLGLRPIVAVP